MKTSMLCTHKPRPPVPSSIDVCDLGGGSGQPRLHTGVLWDVIGLAEVRRKEESFTTVQGGHLLSNFEANNGQAGVGFLANKKWKDNITRVSSESSRVAELVPRLTDIYQLKIVQVYAPTTSHADEETDNFDNTIDNILEKQTHYTIVMGDFNAKVG